MPASVFSGAEAAAPRWPMTAGRSSAGAAVILLTCGSAVVPLSRRRLGLLARTVADVLAGRLVDLLHAELDLAAVVEAEDLDLHLVAHLYHIGDFPDTLRCQLADVDETVLGAEEIHEGAKIDDLDDLAVVDDAELGLRDDAADPVDCRLRGVAVDGGDLDRAVILDIDLGAGNLADLANHLAAGPDHFTDLVLRNGDRRDARRVRADTFAGIGQCLAHLAENVETAILRLTEGDLHDLLGDRGNLDVHL